MPPKTHPGLFVLEANKNQTLDLVLDEQVPRSRELWMATAFIDDSAINMLERWLRLPKRKRPEITLVTGLFHRFNPKRHLLRLQAISQKNISGLKILIAEGPFHWKYYAWRISADQFNILAGSANFTKKGMSLEGEWMTLIKKKIPYPQKDPLTKTFLELLASCTNIAEKDFSDYQECKQEKNKKADADAEKIARAAPKPKINTPNKFLFRIMKLPHQLSGKAADQLYQAKTDWEKKNYNAFLMNNATEYNRAKEATYLVNIFDRNRKYYMEVMERKDDTIWPTDDGKFFVAGKLRKPVIISRKDETALKENGLDVRKRWKSFQHTFAKRGQPKIISSILFGGIIPGLKS